MFQKKSLCYVDAFHTPLPRLNCDHFEPLCMEDGRDGIVDDEARLVLSRVQLAAHRLTQMAEGDVSVTSDASDLPPPSIDLNMAIHNAVYTALDAAHSAVSNARNTNQWNLDQAERALDRAQNMFLSEMLDHECKMTADMRAAIRRGLCNAIPSRGVRQVIRATGRLVITPTTLDDLHVALEDLRSATSPGTRAF